MTVKRKREKEKQSDLKFKTTKTVIVLSDQWDNIGCGSGSRTQVWEEVKCENGVEGGSPLLAYELSQEILHFFFLLCLYY